MGDVGEDSAEDVIVGKLEKRTGWGNGSVRGGWDPGGREDLRADVDSHLRSDEDAQICLVGLVEHVVE